MQISFNGEAVAEAEAAALWYKAEGGSETSQAFAKEVRRVVELVVTQPTLGAPGRYRTRVVPLHKFPYSLIYRIQADTLRVLAIAHQRRRPGYWGKRS